MHGCRHKASSLKQLTATVFASDPVRVHSGKLTFVRLTSPTLLPLACDRWATNRHVAQLSFGSTEARAIDLQTVSPLSFHLCQ